MRAGAAAVAGADLVCCCLCPCCCSSSVSAGPTILLDSTPMSWLRQQWCPGVPRQWVSTNQHTVRRHSLTAGLCWQPYSSSSMEHCSAARHVGAHECGPLASILLGRLTTPAPALTRCLPPCCCTRVCLSVCACVCAGDRSGAQIVDDTLRQAAARGINTVRMWAHTTNSIYPFQVGRHRQQRRQTGPHPHSSSAGTKEPQQQQALTTATAPTALCSPTS